VRQVLDSGEKMTISNLLESGSSPSLAYYIRSRTCKNGSSQIIKIFTAKRFSGWKWEIRGLAALTLCANMAPNLCGGT
jgi:hypothetical protein